MYQYIYICIYTYRYTYIKEHIKNNRKQQKTQGSSLESFFAAGGEYAGCKQRWQDQRRQRHSW